MRIFDGLSLAAFVSSAIMLATPSQEAMAQAGIELGVLTCTTVPGTARTLLVHSSVESRCVFARTDGGVERYRGESGIGLGVDLNWGRDETMRFTVISATSDVRPAAYLLAGRYVGAEASATLGVGTGTAVLVGGGEKNITLQPLAFATSAGWGLGAGVGYLYLARYGDDG